MESNRLSAGVQNATRRKMVRVLKVLAGGGHIRQIPTIDVGTEAGRRLYGLFKDTNRLSLPAQKLEREFVQHLLSNGLTSQKGSLISITSEGRGWLKRQKSGTASNDLREQHLDVQSTSPVVPTASNMRDTFVTANAAESPLIWLYIRKGKSGEPLITPSQYKAGLRLHGDYRQAGVDTLTTAKWDSPMSRSGRKGGGGLPSNPGEHRLDALQRFRSAIDDVGPELSGVLVDVCCLERGLGDVEASNRWPRRSAKVILDLGLTRLARHYGLEASQTSVKRTMRHWGDDSYRPGIDGNGP